MSKQVHTHRLVMSVVLAATVTAATLQAIGALALEGGSPPAEATAGNAKGVVVAMPSPAITSGGSYASADSYTTGDPVHSASMMVVGTFLIGIGSLVRRAA